MAKAAAKKASKVYDEVLKANKGYVSGFGDKGKLALPPARRFAILTCMDARLDPAKYAGLSEGDAHVIATPAGARATTPSARSSSRTSCSARANGSSSTIQIAGWSSSPAR